MTDPVWGDDVWEEDWDNDEPQTVGERLREYGKNIVIVVVLGGLLFLSGIYQGTLFQRTPEVTQEAIPPVVSEENISIPLSITVFQSSGMRGSERSEENVRQIVDNADAILNQASIGLVIDEIVFASVTDQDVEQFIEYPTALFEQFTDLDYGGINVFLIETLNGINGIAFTSARTVAVADFTTVRDFRTLAHEVGHILGLSHSSNRGDLMFSGSNGTDLSESEIERARSRAEAFRDTL